ncbi:MAG: T9SS type A sorting domain-containing protein [Bacteroidetes bacterium]|nr:T9SS type A sorting domain-containing protein [Bacteroidota bacterium]
MKKYLLAFTVLGFSLFYTLWMAQSSFSFKENRQSLNAAEMPDDREGLAQYNYERLRDPKTGEIPINIRRQELLFVTSLPQRNAASRSTEWQNRGPYNLGGRTRALSLDITDEDIILAGQVSGGMWRSTDGGASFSKTTAPLQLHSTTCVAQDKRIGKTDTWYYGTGEEYAIVSASSFSARFSGDGIFKSINGGKNWTQLPSTISNTPTTLESKRDFDFVWEIATNPANSNEDEVLAAVINGIWRSTDGGISWTSVLGLDTAVAGISMYTDVAITSTGVMYATISKENISESSGGIYRSTDGVNWTNITPIGFAGSYSRIEIGIAPSDESQVYFIAQTPGVGATGHSLWKYHYLSGDGSSTGGQWINRTNNIPNDHCFTWDNFDVQKFNSQSSYNLLVVVHPLDTNIVIIGGTNLYRSYDGFSSPIYDWVGGYRCDTALSFSGYSYPNHHSDEHKLLFLPSNPSVAISGSDGGVIKSENILAPTVAWSSLNNGYNTGQFYTCAIEPGNTTSEVIVGGLQDNGTYFTNTADYKQPWAKVFYGDGSYCAIAHNKYYPSPKGTEKKSELIYYLSWQNGKLYKLTLGDNGEQLRRTRIDQKGGGGYGFINPFILDPLDDNVMYVSGNVIRRNDSLNYIPITENEKLPITQGWKTLQGSSMGNSIFAPKISSLDISEANTDLLYFGTSDGQVFKISGCKTNVAASRQGITGTDFPTGAYVSCVEADRLDSNRVLVTFSNYGVRSVFYTIDGGASWMDVSGNLEQNPDGTGNGPAVFWGHIYNDGTTLRYFVGTSTGLYSTDLLKGTQTIWTQEGANTIGNVNVNMITSRTFDNTIVVATHGNGIYSNKIFTPSSIKEDPTNILSINYYPNPFHHATSMKRNDGDGGEVYADVFDLNGTLLKRIPKTSGKQLIWDGKNSSGNDAPIGIYLIKTYVGNKSAITRVMKL